MRVELEPGFEAQRNEPGSDGQPPGEARREARARRTENLEEIGGGRGNGHWLRSS